MYFEGVETQALSTRGQANVILRHLTLLTTFMATVFPSKSWEPSTHFAPAGSARSSSMRRLYIERASPPKPHSARCSRWKSDSSTPPKRRAQHDICSYVCGISRSLRTRRSRLAPRPRVMGLRAERGGAGSVAQRAKCWVGGCLVRGGHVAVCTAATVLSRDMTAVACPGGIRHYRRENTQIIYI